MPRETKNATYDKRTVRHICDLVRFLVNIGVYHVCFNKFTYLLTYNRRHVINQLPNLFIGILPHNWNIVI